MTLNKGPQLRGHGAWGLLLSSASQGGVTPPPAPGGQGPTEHRPGDAKPSFFKNIQTVRAVGPNVLCFNAGSFIVPSFFITVKYA